MKKCLLCLLTLVLLLNVVIPVTARADLKLGSSGEEVASLQMMLFDMGYLFEEPDGKFGAKTEAAVKKYQKAAGMEETRAVTDAMRESYYANGTEIDPTDVYYGAELWMRAYCAWLCQMLNTLSTE